MPDHAIQRIAMFSVHTCPLATLGGKETGGMNVYVRELARELGRRGLAVDVFTRSQDPGIPRISRKLGDCVRVIHLPAGPETPYNKNLIYDHLAEFAAGVRGFAEADGIRYDVQHSHYWLSGLVARELRAGWGTPIVHMFHTLAELKNRVAQSPAEMEPPRRIACEGDIMRFADRLIAATTLERDQMRALYGADPEKVSIVPPGVDLEKFRPLPCSEARARIGLPPDHHMVLFVGRIQPIKGIDTLIRAMALVLERRPALRDQVCLTLVGGADDATPDSEMARLKALREELGIGDLVTFPGSRDQDTLVDYYTAASIVVVPSYYESFGMVALEAMACGTPVIASDVGGLSLNIADGFNGYLVASGDVEALAYKITLLLTQDELRRQLGRQAHTWATGFSWQIIADETLAAYDLARGREPQRYSLTGAERDASWQYEERACP
jgi:D-inositol-3-phosphate glycosyltransferase